MPRFGTVNPVALATIACSKEIFVPSAKLVTMYGSWPHFSAKPFCVVGLRYGSCRPLMLPRDQRRARPMPLHEADEVHLHARLVAVGAGEDDAGLRRRGRASSGPTVPSSSAFIVTTCLPRVDRGER